eukprot:11009094-Lingulodinium_polyedra.AAC.1
MASRCARAVNVVEAPCAGARSLGAVRPVPMGLRRPPGAGVPMRAQRTQGPSLKKMPPQASRPGA